MPIAPPSAVALFAVKLELVMLIFAEPILLPAFPFVIPPPIEPVRMTGLVVGAPQTFRYFQRIQEQIADFVTANSKISKEDFEHYMMATGEMATDVGTILYGKDAVASGLIDSLGDLNDALTELHAMIDTQKADSK